GKKSQHPGPVIRRLPAQREHSVFLLKQTYSINGIQSVRLAFIFQLSGRQLFVKVTPLLHWHGDFYGVYWF
ncbi:hypothetical protein ACQP3L_31115, partial [Escherichia coli]